MNDHYDELKKAYDMFDKDGGGISKDELSDAMKAFGKDVSDEELEEMIIAADKDGNRQIDFEEFLTMMTLKLEEQEMEKELHTAFECFDRNGDGSITCKELRFIVKSLGECLTDAEADFMI